ncbi:MAG: hypothetical protein ABI203_05710 [Mucilaginibacter sp.]
MTKRIILILSIIVIIATGCAMYQSFIKSSFPYTTTLVVPAFAKPGIEYSAISVATSFDQNFTKNGDNGDKIARVRVTSAKLMSVSPTDYDIGNLASVKVYLSKEGSNDEIMVASRSDIGENAGNNIVLDIDNSQLLDELMREPGIRVRMAYKVRKPFDRDVSLHIVVGMNAYPSPEEK